mmetsp:Transcript_105061/g.295879  ORF Transcript_105061/g.295879 Transcript_105061/m.295879 type:complete len:214 (+) Transcript_105061:117-758(+)
MAPAPLYIAADGLPALVTAPLHRDNVPIVGCHGVVARHLGRLVHWAAPLEVHRRHGVVPRVRELRRDCTEAAALNCCQEPVQLLRAGPERSLVVPSNPCHRRRPEWPAALQELVGEEKCRRREQRRPVLEHVYVKERERDKVVHELRVERVIPQVRLEVEDALNEVRGPGSVDVELEGRQKLALLNGDVVGFTCSGRHVGERRDPWRHSLLDL